MVAGKSAHIAFCHRQHAKDIIARIDQHFRRIAEADDHASTGTIDRLIADLEKTEGSPDDILLWQARWLVGNNDLDGADALQAVREVRALDADTQRIMVREMVYSALRTTGRDFNNPNSAYAGNYERGYAALERVFPGLRDKNEDGSFKNYQGEINLFASRIKTERGGNIEFMVPGGRRGGRPQQHAGSAGRHGQ